MWKNNWSKNDITIVAKFLFEFFMRERHKNTFFLFGIVKKTTVLVEKSDQNNVWAAQEKKKGWKKIIREI